MELSKLPAGLKWHKIKSNKIPEEAIVGGRNSNNEPIFIGMTKHARENIPGGVFKKNGKYIISIPYACRTFEFNNNFFILCADKNVQLEWIRRTNGLLTSNPVHLNREICVGRTMYCNEMMVGKIHMSHKCLYVPYNESEIHFNEYEVLNVLTLE